jgi:DNA-binding response OmpR family regulator
MDNRGTILVVDDEKTIRTVVGEALRRKGYTTQSAANADEALRLCEQLTFDLALIDLKMPGKLDGLGLLKEISRRWPATVVIVLTGYGTLDSAIAAIREGAYDYIAKPGNLAQIVESVERGLAKRREEAAREEMIDQLEVMLRGLKRQSKLPRSELPPAERFFESPGLKIDRQRRLAVRDGKELTLTAAEFDMLEYLARNSDKVVTAAELIKAIQGYDLSEPEARPLVRVQIQRLRRKLEDHPDHPRYILNVRGRGYRFTG